MSTNEAAALIQVLSDTLQVPTQQVLVYYMDRIAGLWIQAGIWAATALAFLATLQRAVSATVAPEAYAIDAVIRQLRG